MWRVGGRGDPAGPISTSIGTGLPARLLYNFRLPSRLSGSSPDLAVGFDLDGFLASGTRPHVVCLKGIVADELRFERGLTRLRLEILARLERRNVARADRVLVTSRYSRRVAVDRYGLEPGRVGIVPEGIDLSLWPEPEPPGTARPEAPVILSVARQYPRKNTATLLRAFPSVREAFPTARLRVVGGGPELPRLRALARALPVGGIELTGELARDEAVRREFRSGHVFCLPSRQEGFGIAFLEAMAAGLPIVGPAAAAVPEVVPRGEAGLLVDPDDPDAVAGALRRLLGDAELRRRLGRAGRRRALSFGWPAVARRFLREVKSLRRDEPGG